MALRTWAALGPALLLLAGCALVVPPAGMQPARGAAEVCVPLFREFDQLSMVYGNGRFGRRGEIGSAPVMRQGDRLLRAGCLARSAELDQMATAPRGPVAESGAPIRPISLHAGVVQGLADEARVRTHFAERGVRVRSVGHLALGRRIYLGPFATEGGLAAAAQAAREAGFVAPYPAFF